MRLIDASAGLAEDHRARDGGSVEGHGDGGRTADAELVFLGTHGHPRRLAGHENQGVGPHSAEPRRACEYRVAAGETAVGHVDLFAVEADAVVDERSRGANASQIGARLGLGGGERRDARAADDLGEHGALQLGVAEFDQGTHPEPRVEPNHDGGRTFDGREICHHGAGRLEGEAGSAVLLGHGQPKQAGVGHGLAERDRDLAFAIDASSVREARDQPNTLGAHQRQRFGFGSRRVRHRQPLAQDVSLGESDGDGLRRQRCRHAAPG